MPQTPHAPPSVRARIGGRWAITSWLVGIAALFTLIPALAPVGGIVVNPLTTADPTIVGVAAQVGAVCAVILIAHLTIFRHRAEHPVPVWWVFALGVAGGGARLAVQVAQADESTVAARGAVTVALAVLSILVASSLVPPVVAYLVATREWYVGERERLIARAAEVEAERMRAVGSLRDIAQTAIQGDLDRVRSVLDRDQSRPEDVAAALLSAARGGVRPAAQTMLDRRSASRTRVSLRAVLTSELHRAPLPIRVPAVGFAVMIAPRALVALGPAAALIVPVLAVLGIIAVFPLGQRVIRRRTQLALPITVVACAIAVAPAAAMLAFGLPARSPLVVFGVMAFVLLVLVVVAGMVATAEALGEEALARLGAPIREAEVERIAADQAREALLREIALHLHGSVQSGLVAASYAIREALEAGDVAALEDAMTRARAALDQDVLPPLGAMGGAGDSTTAIAWDWDGVLDVEWRVEDGELLSAAAAEVVRECLANAVVHGQATHAIVQVRREADELVVEVEDDGCGPRGGPAGVGSALLDRRTGGRWRLEPVAGGGARVRATLPAVLSTQPLGR